MPSDRLRTLVDKVCAGVGLALLAPLFGLVAVWIKLDSPGPVLHRARRVGMGGKPFYLYKFRTMLVNAMVVGPPVTIAKDPRVTKAGHVLREFKIDELPQLFNVLKGDMSLVGPRPEDPRYVALYTPVQRDVLRVRPGITSPASLLYRREAEMLAGPDWEAEYVKRIMPRKLEMELSYLRERTIRSDLSLILRTIRALYSRRMGA